jgi:hypothetical protein
MMATEIDEGTQSFDCTMSGEPGRGAELVVYGAKSYSGDL